MKLLNKFFTIGVSAMAVTPLLTSCVPTNVMNVVAGSNELYTPLNDESEIKHEACTVTYIGKECTANGCPIAARATDCSPKAVHLKLKHYAENELAGKTLVGKLGMRYTMPSHTLAYTSCPLSDKTSSDPTWASGMWENNGINEMGVGVSATLTCATNNSMVGYTDSAGTFHHATVVKEGETYPEEFTKTGAGEELLPIIMAAQATSAKNAMEVAAAAIDAHGAQDANIIFAVDQNEAWLMEIYTNHQYCAVKLPDDKVFIAGNEFILNSLAELGITKEHPENCIISQDLWNMPHKYSLDKYDDSVTEKDVYHMNLFKTYAEEGPNDTVHHEGYDLKFSDSCHMRTWRGYSLFDPSGDVAKLYSNTTKYDPFLTPKDKNGAVRKDMSARDVMDVYRDEFDELVIDDGSELHKPFVEAKAAGKLRCIAVPQTRAIHIMSSDSTKPKWIAANQWYTPDSANYAPYLLINNAMTSIDGEFGYYPDRFEFTEDCSSVLYRELNALAWLDRTHYGMPLQDFWEAFEDVYCKQMQQVIEEASTLTSIANAKTIVTNFNKRVRDIYVSQVKKTKNDLLWHIMDMPGSSETNFIPLIDFEQYVTDLGWSNYKFDGSKVTFERNSIKATFTLSDGTIYKKGTLVLNDGTTADLKDSVVDGKVYVDMLTLNNAIKGYSEVKHININDYLNETKVNHAVWIVPLVITVALAAGIVTYVLIKKRKNKKAQTPTDPTKPNV